MDFDDRQWTAAVIGGVLVAVIPVLLGIGMLLLSGWLLTFNVVPNIHATVWGWLSHHHYEMFNGHRHGVWGVGRIVPEYYASVFTAYLVYQVGELLYGSFRVFRRALTA